MNANFWKMDGKKLTVPVYTTMILNLNRKKAVPNYPNFVIKNY
jgi:hypothetical protein